MVSVLLPVIRPEGAERCRQAIAQNAGIGAGGYEIVSEIDTQRAGCPKMVKRLAAKARFELVMFLADDTCLKKNCMKNALTAMSGLPNGWGLVGLNDQHHDGNVLATHWLADKRLLPMIGGEFFHTGYWHSFCDRELTERCKALGRYVWAADAVIVHDHPAFSGGPMDADYARVYSAAWFRHDLGLYQRRKENGWQGN